VTGRGPRGPRVLALGLGVLIAGAAAAAALPRVAHELPAPLAAVAALPERLWARVAPPRVPRGEQRADLTDPERQAVEMLAGRLDARIVWSSNRGGNHDLYLLDLRTRTVRALTRHPHVDFFARFSPDGRQVVFNRSQRPYVSFRDASGWDVYVTGTDGTGERLLARHGYWPQWTPDGTAVTFARGPQVIRLDLATGRETVLLDAATTEGIRGGIETPELAPDGGRLALTGRSPTFAGVAVIDLATGAMTRIQDRGVCQLTWTPAGGLLWVESEGRGGTRIVGLAPGAAPGAARVLMDLPGRHSHEYFPRVSNDGRWLVWGAAAEGHEHDRADYELFVWELGRPVAEAIRLTHHPGNDQWPDIFVGSR
jgi:Tol biopolymer transport system component